ncbi:MAG: CoA transferase [Phyllobacteriaceae bacterium]|nr:CoA transferase [Phyllobacteriaceae bacterium]MBA91837.1 CoA transferase [Phyllobacteriaceae bacterium]
MGDSPLNGIRVIELARILAGPWAGQLLADLGADVIKVEKPGDGDDTRHWGPPFVTGADGENLSAAYYHSTNRGKRSVAIDIASPEGAETVRRLIAGADVVIENFKVGGLKKYGLDYESVKALNPRLVYCSITGFGQTGPYAPRAGYDFIIQAMAGMMSITGEPGREPQKAGVAISDIFTGLYSVIAIQAALRHAERTGEGQWIDMALFDTQAGILGNQNLNYLVSGVAPKQMGNAHMNIAPYEVFPVSDGHVIIAVGNDGQFQRFCKLLGAADLARDPQFQKNPDRVSDRERLREAIIGYMKDWTKADMLAACEANAVPAGPINNIAEMFADPQIKARQMRFDLADRAGTEIPQVRAPILLPASPLNYRRPSPRLGEHTAEVLGELKEDSE